MAQVFIVDDHGAIRSGLSLLAESAGHEVVASTGTLADARSKIRGHRPDVAVIDVGLPDGLGHTLVAELRPELPDTRFLLYTGLDDPEIFLACLASGAEGYALKGGSADEFLAALESVIAGQNYFDPRIGARLRAADKQDGRLRPREREVLGLIAAGNETQQIADHLIVSPETVRSHVRNILDRLGAHTRAQAVAIAILRGELTLTSADVG